jgi:hypothetical protein
MTMLASAASADQVDVEYTLTGTVGIPALGIPAIGPPLTGTTTIRWQGTPGSNIVPGPFQPLGFVIAQPLSFTALGDVFTGTFRFTLPPATTPAGTLFGATNSGTIVFAAPPGTGALSGFVHCFGGTCPIAGFTSSVPFPLTFSFTGATALPGTLAGTQIRIPISFPGFGFAFTSTLVGQEVGTRTHIGPPGPTTIKVNKTASFDGRFVSGTISITNGGENPAIISAIADSLEVHFPKKLTPPPLPDGSTKRWFKVADVPIDLPEEIPVGETVDIDYSFDLCRAADFTAANAMRNAVAVTLENKPAKARVDTVVTRSKSFEPAAPECPVGPVTEDLSPCFTFDDWEFEVIAGEAVFIEADTVDAATAADLCFFGSCPGNFFGGDDNVACTFPPPAFSCPQDSFVASTGGTCTIAVRTCSSACADPGMANYSLTVQRDGVFADLTLVGDDQ